MGGKPLALVLVEIQDAWAAGEDDASVDDYIQAATEADDVEATPPTIEVPDTAPVQEEDVDDDGGTSTTTTSTTGPSPSTTSSTSTSSTTSSTAPDVPDVPDPDDPGAEG